MLHLTGEQMLNHGMAGEEFPRLLLNEVREAIGQLRLPVEAAQILQDCVIAVLTQDPTQHWRRVLLNVALPLVVERIRIIYEFHCNVHYADAEDLSQDVAVKVLKALNGQSPNRNLGAWLISISKHTLADLARKRAYHSRGMDKIKNVLRKWRRI